MLGSLRKSGSDQDLPRSAGRTRTGRRRQTSPYERPSSAGQSRRNSGSGSPRGTAGEAASSVWGGSALSTLASTVSAWMPGGWASQPVFGPMPPPPLSDADVAFADTAAAANGQDGAQVTPHALVRLLRKPPTLHTRAETAGSTGTTSTTAPAQPEWTIPVSSSSLKQTLELWGRTHGWGWSLSGRFVELPTSPSVCAAAFVPVRHTIAVRKVTLAMHRLDLNGVFWFGGARRRATQRALQQPDLPDGPGLLLWRSFQQKANESQLWGPSLRSWVETSEPPPPTPPLLATQRYTDSNGEIKTRNLWEPQGLIPATQDAIAGVIRILWELVPSAPPDGGLRPVVHVLTCATTRGPIVSDASSVLDRQLVVVLRGLLVVPIVQLERVLGKLGQLKRARVAIVAEAGIVKVTWPIGKIA